MISRRFGRLVCNLRKRDNLTLKLLANMLFIDNKNVSQSFISMIENSGRIPHTNIINQLAGIFKVNAQLFFDAIKEDNPGIAEDRIIRTIRQYNTEENRLSQFDDKNENKKRMWKMFNNLMSKNEANLSFEDALESNFGWG